MSILGRFSRQLEVRQNESENRRGLRMSIVEGVSANMLGNLLGGPLQILYLTYLGFNAFHVGLILAIPSLTLIVQIFVAFAMQRWTNRRRVMLFLGVTHRTLWVCTGFIPLLFSEQAWIWAYVIVFLASFTAAQATGVIWSSLMADVVAPSIRGKYFGIRNTIHWAVICVTLFIGGQLMEVLPGPKGFMILFAISALCIIWNGWALSKHPNPPFQPSENPAAIRMLLRPLQDEKFRAATLFVALFLLAQNVVVPLFSYAMLNILNLSTSGVTLIVMFQNIIMMISYYYWGILNGRYSAQSLLFWTFPIIAVSCVAWLGMAVLPIILVLIVVHLFLGIGLAGYNILVFNFIIGDSPKSERPMYIAVFSALTGFAGFLGPMIGGRLYDAAKDGPPWITQYGMIFVMGVAMLLLSLVVGSFVFRQRA